jgi:hypothetical protein
MASLPGNPVSPIRTGRTGDSAANPLDWTGDKRLINGLRQKGYLRIVTTNDLYDVFIDKQLRKRKIGK